MLLNQTPIRTAKNYGINDIDVDVNFPEKICEFEGLNLRGDLDKIRICKDKKINTFKYGNGKVLLDQIQKQANVELQIDVEKDLKEVILDFNLSKENENLIENVLINVNENVSGTIIIRFISQENQAFYHNGQIKVTSQKGSNLNIILLNLLNENSQNFISIENILEENAALEYTIVDFGGKNSITNYYSNLKGDRAKNNVNTIYFGNNEQLLDLNYIADVYGKKADINMNLKGAITNKAKKHFKGTIDFKRGCKKAKGDENEYCTILQDSAKSMSLPILLCSEEDVEGNHSAAAGKIDPKQLFYLMTRGFSTKEAQKLAVRAGFNEIIETIQNEEIKSQIIEEMEKKL